MSQELTAQQIVTEIASATQAQPHELTLFFHDHSGAVVFDVVTQDFTAYVHRPDGLQPDGSAPDLPTALQMLALAAAKWERFDAQQPAAQQAVAA